MRAYLTVLGAVVVSLTSADIILVVPATNTAPIILKIPGATNATTVTLEYGASSKSPLVPPLPPINPLLTNVSYLTTRSNLAKTMVRTNSGPLPVASGPREYPGGTFRYYPDGKTMFRVSTNK